MRLTVLGQALIGHDLRARPWPDLPRLVKILGRADAVFADLETAIVTPLAEAPTRDSVFLHAAPPAVLDCLKDLSVSLLATANNHVWDLGTVGILGMLEELDWRGFTHAGAGRHLAAAAAPAYRPTDNGTVALVACASGAIRAGAAATMTRAGVNELRLGDDGTLNADDRQRVLVAIAAAAKQAQIVLACHHNHIFGDTPSTLFSPAGGGVLGSGRSAQHPPGWLQGFARACIDAGAALYVGHGAPRLQGIELYRGQPIFYNLSSLVFQTTTAPGHYEDEVWHSVVAECDFVEGRFGGARLVPLQLNSEGIGGPGDLETRGRPSLARGADAEAILGRLDALSRPFASAITRVGDSATIASS
jgi:poly-gamma-glutamate capsule biosynthesis protein CapA/YwtB (metallophosphatase superfamily)